MTFQDREHASVAESDEEKSIHTPSLENASIDNIEVGSPLLAVCQLGPGQAFLERLTLA